LIQAIERVVGVPRRAWWKQRLLALAWVIGTLVAFAIASFGIIAWENVIDAPDDVAVVATPAPVARPEAQPAPEDAPLVKRPRGPSIPEVARAPARHARKLLRSGGERVLAVGFSLAVAIGGLAAFYRFAVAHTRQVRRRVLPGAVVAIVLVIVISWGFSVYVRTLASYTLYYGGLAAIAVLLIWLWLMSLAILVGAELNSQLEGLRDLDEDARD
jgi:membrane protein